MSKHQFKYYLHDDYQTSEREDFLASPQFGNLPADVAKQIAEMRPFYEVTLECEYDTETQQLTILSTTP